ncbi:MAG: tRNA-uridine aminocarboxypropyltransferase [Alphaproteobacteria bacterium]
MLSTDAPQPCPACEKTPQLCVCAAVAPIENRVEVLILRHPQEQDRILGTARLTVLQLERARLKTGLSWRNLSNILDRPVDPKLWGVLYLGTARQAAPLPPQPLTVLTAKSTPTPEQESILAALEGIILLDGSWAQAKALWWRNAWLLKCRRLVLQPPRLSLYGTLRKEPRRDSVATIEAAAYTLAALDHDPALAEKILLPFRLLLEKARAARRNP